MLARLATFNSQPADPEDANVQYLRDTIKSVPGFIAGFHMLDEQSGKGLLTRGSRGPGERCPGPGGARPTSDRAARRRRSRPRAIPDRASVLTQAAKPAQRPNPAAARDSNRSSTRMAVTGPRRPPPPIAIASTGPVNHPSWCRAVTTLPWLLQA
jgi:hypothetical protein